MACMTQEQLELYEMHKPNLSSTVNLIEESPRKKLKGIGNTSRKPQKCCVITDVAECPADLRAMHEKLQQMLAEEERHGALALEQGGEEFSDPLKRMMRTASQVMTKTTYWL